MCVRVCVCVCVCVWYTCGVACSGITASLSVTVPGTNSIMPREAERGTTSYVATDKPSRHAPAVHITYPRAHTHEYRLGTRACSTHNVPTCTQRMHIDIDLRVGATSCSWSCSAVGKSVCVCVCVCVGVCVFMVSTCVLSPYRVHCVKDLLYPLVYTHVFSTLDNVTAHTSTHTNAHEDIHTCVVYVSKDASKGCTNTACHCAQRKHGSMCIQAGRQTRIQTRLRLRPHRYVCKHARSRARTCVLSGR